MARSKGFSLIETLAAVTIASIATMALMRVVSYSSTISSNALKHFDSSILMSLALENIDEAQSTNISDALHKRYSIDHPLIREELQTAAYEILLLPKENITPFINGMGSSSLIDSLYVQKVIIKSSQETKSFFRITSNKQ